MNQRQENNLIANSIQTTKLDITDIVRSMSHTEEHNIHICHYIVHVLKEKILASKENK